MKFFKALDWLMEKLCAFLMVLMCLCSFAQVVNRYAFGRSFSWTDEIVIFSMVWVTFFGSALAVSRNSHTRIDFFVSLFPPKIRSWILAFSDVVCAAFVAALGYVSLPVFRKNLTIFSSGLHWPMAVSYFALQVGCVVMFIYFLVLAWREVKGLTPGAQPAGNGEAK